MKFYMSCKSQFGIDGIENIEALSNWRWFRKRPGVGYDSSAIDWNIVEKRFNDQRHQLHGNTRIICDVEFSPMPSREKELVQVIQAVKYYSERFPNTPVAPYRIVPKLNYQVTKNFNLVRGQTSHPRYWKYREAWQKLQKDNTSKLARELAQVSDFITTRMYMPYQYWHDQYWDFADRYVQLAHRHHDPVVGYFTPHFLKGGKQIDGEIWRELMNRAEHRWGMEAVIIWLDDNNPGDIDPNSEWRQVTRELAGVV